MNILLFLLFAVLSLSIAQVEPTFCPTLEPTFDQTVEPTLEPTFGPTVLIPQIFDMELNEKRIFLVVFPGRCHINSMHITMYDGYDQKFGPFYGPDHQILLNLRSTGNLLMDIQIRKCSLTVINITESK